MSTPSLPPPQAGFSADIPSFRLEIEAPAEAEHEFVVSGHEAPEIPTPEEVTDLSPSLGCIRPDGLPVMDPREKLSKWWTPG